MDRVREGASFELGSSSPRTADVPSRSLQRKNSSEVLLDVFPLKNMASWMGEAEDRRMLDELYLPGTHVSTTPSPFATRRLAYLRPVRRNHSPSTVDPSLPVNPPHFLSHLSSDKEASDSSTFGSH